MNPNSHRLVYLAVAVALVIGVGAGFAAHSLMGSRSASPAAARHIAPTTPISSTTTTDSLTQIYEQDAPGVVTITVDGRTPATAGSNPFGIPQQQFEALGTGFEINSSGDIMTAEHVVSGASTIKVTFQDGTTAKATLVGSDSSTDSAVIHVDVPAAQLHPLTLGNSSSVLPGQTVVAIGTPLSSNYSESMTAGIVSAINRTISAPNGFSIPGSIQTDAAINHGNSGGPLIDVATNSVIGINDQLPTGTVNANVGIGFAAPIDSAKSAAQTLIAGGTPQHAYMGVKIDPGNTSGGARLAHVFAGTPAAKAGLKAGDVITAWNGKSVLDSDALTAYVTQSRVNESVQLTILRNGKTQHVTLTLGDQPATAQ